MDQRHKSITGSEGEGCKNQFLRLSFSINEMLSIPNQKSGGEFLGVFFSMLLGSFSFPFVVQAGVIADAPPLIVGLTKILDFLLVILGMLAILGMIGAGMLYFLAGGDKRQLLMAKGVFRNVIVGIMIALGSMVIVWTIAKLLS